IRVPGWATGPREIFVNGKKQVAGTPGTYITLDRKWKSRDEIRFTLPMGFRLTKYAGIEKGFKDREAYALEYGPLLMAVVGESVQNGEIGIPLSKAELIGKLKPVAGSPLHFAIIDGTERTLKYIPYYEVKGTLLDTFTCYPVLR
ncbi:MAG: glycoside hydrolase family 127 protein, partial [Prevotellaceae bacterium]|nr:glycoside hydrolase family 127 protein [Prevotellaceae bacterium]